MDRRFDPFPSNWIELEKEPFLSSLCAVKKINGKYMANKISSYKRILIWVYRNYSICSGESVLVKLYCFIDKMYLSSNIQT